MSVATKAELRSLAQAMAKEYAAEGIHVGYVVRRVGMDEIEANDFNLNISRSVSTAAGAQCRLLANPVKRSYFLHGRSR